MNSITSAFRAASLISAVEQMARAEGISLEVRTDIENYGPVREDQPGRGPVTVMFDPAYADVDAHNSFWIQGSDSKGKIVHTQAARYFDIDSESMAQQFYENMALNFMRLEGTDKTCSDADCPMMHERIQGLVCYHGEIWLDSKYRGKGLSKYLPRLLMALAFVKWSPSYIFGLIPEKLANCGIGTQYGYFHIEPNGFVLNIPEMPIIRKWLVWMAAEDMHRLVGQLPEAES